MGMSGPGVMDKVVAHADKDGQTVTIWIDDKPFKINLLHDDNDGLS